MFLLHFDFLQFPRIGIGGIKAITLQPKRNTITSNEEQKSIMSIEISNFINSCSYRLILFS